MLKNYEYKNCAIPNLEVKAIDAEQRTVTFYAAAFGSVDSHGDIILKGAFAKTIKENAARFKWLNQHDTYQLIGRVLSIEEDDFGLLVTCKASETTLGNDVLALESDRTYEHSIGFNTIVSEWDSSQEIRIIKEIQLWEVSSVTWGSNPNTPTVSMKSMSRQEKGDYLLKKLSRLHTTLRKKNISDERVEMLELEVLQINQSIQDLLSESKSLEETPEPPVESTPEVEEPTNNISVEDILNVFTKAITTNK
ncbi:HK97 family phage prohead protease [Hymenobacter aerilatus]|uniref:HK97 family phage prohead protease n=1 Tax=Hymenobacter aerilatus TaxID=2932251 RepID=A0A8T9T1H8_9BACT|nr:HK97 family phage prohead protease [Hymenobacter aerilatus]UOR05859.1 HK97 family phage prohead protease [Hymenobacter aerilatus]